MLDNGMICKGGGFVIQRHDELRVLDIEHGTLISLIFTTTGRMSDFDTNKIRLCSKVVSSLLLWIPLLSLPLLSLVWLHYLFDTLILNFFYFLSKWAFARYPYQNLNQIPALKCDHCSVWFHKARNDKMGRSGKKKSQKNILYAPTSNKQQGEFTTLHLRDVGR